MKYKKNIVVWSGLFFFVGLLAAAPQASAQSCCDKATALSKPCSHPCCAARYQLGKICFKCNANKATTCCDKREVAGETCNHPCCQSATALSSVCFKCNPGRTAVIFNGKDLSEKVWKFKGDKGPGNWVVGIAKLSPDNPNTLILETGKADLIKKGQGQMVNLPTKGKKSVDIYTIAKFGDSRIELDVMVPKGSNSGIYVMGEYEIQVLDSYGKEKVGKGDMGGFYGIAPPKVNASKPPGEWQKFLIEFRAPRFDKEGKKTAHAKFIKVVLNGKTIHENVELPKVTNGGLTGTEAATGPIMFQGDHGQVAFRNLRITDTAKAKL